jgi:TonB family protein
MLGPLVLAVLVSFAHTGLIASLDRQQPAAVQQPASPGGQPVPEETWPPPGVSRPGAGTTAPKVNKRTYPNYTADAMRAKVQGSIILDVVVEPDGTVSKVRVVTSLDKEYGLDDEAVRTVKKWRFEPGKRDGVAVPVLVDVEMTFSMRN